jgi:hypothetical protein
MLQTCRHWLPAVQLMLMGCPGLLPCTKQCQISKGIGAIRSGAAVSDNRQCCPYHLDLSWSAPTRHGITRHITPACLSAISDTAAPSAAAASTIARTTAVPLPSTGPTGPLPFRLVAAWVSATGCRAAPCARKAEHHDAAMHAMLVLHSPHGSEVTVLDTRVYSRVEWSGACAHR